ncbi:MAG: hypothetical protein K0Q87_5275 [Neobacillus sp.]|jgi:hypothetical protein|nr:hypothetical protein [Neobacillus sp.]MDF2859424.1 hypothetical protein [Neobacillus sp.]
MDTQESSYKEYIVKHKRDCVEIFNDPRQVLRIKKDKKDDSKVVIELHSSLNGRFSMNVYSELIKKILNELD